MTKTDYELTIGGKLRKVYKNSGGFFVKMNGGNLDVNEYFLKNGGGLKSKYKKQAKVKAKEYKKKITGGYPILLIKNNTYLQKAVSNFMSVRPGSNPIPEINFEGTNINQDVQLIVKDIIAIFFTQEFTEEEEEEAFKNKLNRKKYIVKLTDSDTKLSEFDLHLDDDYQANIKDDIQSFYKMYILHYFFNNYAPSSDNDKKTIIDRYKAFIDKGNNIDVYLDTTPASDTSIVDMKSSAPNDGK